MNNLTVAALLIALIATVIVCAWAIYQLLEEVRMELSEIRSLLTALVDELIACGAEHIDEEVEA